MLCSATSLLNLVTMSPFSLVGRSLLLNCHNVDLADLFLEEGMCVHAYSTPVIDLRFFIIKNTKISKHCFNQIPLKCVQL